MSVQDSSKEIIIDAEVMASIKHLVELSDKADMSIDELVVVLRSTMEQVKAGM